MTFDEKYDFWDAQADARKQLSKLVLLMFQLERGNLSNKEAWSEILHLLTPEDIANHYYLSGAIH